MKKASSKVATHKYKYYFENFGTTASNTSKGETPPQPNQVKNLDIVNPTKPDDNSRAPDLKPYPLNFADDVLSNMYVASANLRKIVGNAKENPALKKKFTPLLQGIEQRLKQIDKLTVDISKRFDKIK